ncbi:MAG TPA: hypothetical protein VGO88_09700 [Mycetocola sp.]|jgi:hypothetical protein|uniref:hypothetical protein n=1 Tax=Mycetocola sp. TaxID=1871042 RepID=UPI00263396F9|nr:hypothetical protein [Mycetocola sp.]MCU1560134.1 hypothetical protein [Mycetocola sp.]HEV7849577.1 hypothetical protein [Mycetocola sp.]
MIAASWNIVTDAAWRLAATPSPTPTLDIDPNDVTPGPAGFFVVALLAAAVFLLIFDMQRRVRRVNHRAEISERLQAELDERDRVGDDGPASDGGVDPKSGDKPL